MKSIVEGYIGIWIIMILLYICLGFTAINMNVVRARNILNDVKTEVSASNGGMIDESGHYEYNSKDHEITLDKDGYQFTYNIHRISLYEDESDRIYDDAIRDSTFIYNDIYKIELKYQYAVPLFGTQIYPISTLTK